MMDLFNTACDTVGPELVGLTIGLLLGAVVNYLIFIRQNTAMNDD